MAETRTSPQAERKLIEGGAEPLHLVIAGAGVAGLEAMLALRALAHRHVRVELLAPEHEFVYRPLWVAEPFGIVEPRRLPLEGIVRDCHAHHTPASLREVDAHTKVVCTTAGNEIAYDALLLAVGTRASEAVTGALTFAGPPALSEFARLLRELEQGSARDVIFVVPAGVAWSLPIYELALLTADHLRRSWISRARLTVITHERAPLAVFGRAASDRVTELLRDAGVSLACEAVATSFEDGGLRLVADNTLRADRVVALPKLTVAGIPGVPQDARGFIPTDPHGRVHGLEGVFAVGDATWFPIKQGGIATQQADAAAAAIAALAGADVKPAPAEQVLRAALLTGTSVDYLRRDLEGARDTDIARSSLWSPTGKIAGRYLSPYLARGDDNVAASLPLTDLDDYRGQDPEAADGAHQEAMALALESADAEAGWEDYDSALKWLAAAEQLNIVLPPEYVERRASWKEAAGAQRR